MSRASVDLTYQLNQDQTKIGIYRNLASFKLCKRARVYTLRVYACHISILMSRASVDLTYKLHQDQTKIDMYRSPAALKLCKSARVYTLLVYAGHNQVFMSRASVDLTYQLNQDHGRLMCIGVRHPSNFVKWPAYTQRVYTRAIFQFSC